MLFAPQGVYTPGTTDSTMKRFVAYTHAIRLAWAPTGAHDLFPPDGQSLRDVVRQVNGDGMTDGQSCCRLRSTWRRHPGDPEAIDRDCALPPALVEELRAAAFHLWLPRALGDRNCIQPNSSL